MGVDEVDSQHRELFNLVYRIKAAARSRESVTEALPLALEHAAFHFHAEEALMAEVKYPEYASHRAEHERFAQDLLALTARLESGESEVADIISDYLEDWIAGHVTEVDGRLRVFLDHRRP